MEYYPQHIIELNSLELPILSILDLQTFLNKTLNYLKIWYLSIDTS